MSHVYKHSIPASIAEHTLITPEKYQQYYQESVE
ncbi:acetyl-CoA synthetase, partial [Klebsiella pneumoniae]